MPAYRWGMPSPEALVAVARPGVRLRRITGVPAYDGEVVLVGGGEVFRLPLTGAAAARAAVLVRALPALRVRLPVAVPLPRFVGVLADGSTPFTAERRLPGTPVEQPTGIAAGQLEGVLAALAEVTAHEAAQWGAATVPRPQVLLHDRGRGVLTGLVAWR